MARLTILQASQQGFGSTLTIHRHIKDGSLPVYEEGDVKLLEVDDLISVFGEPGTPINDNLTPASEPDRIDIYEYNRMKQELEQKNKKNMWLAADLAEVVRELKDKEAKFEAERARLLKVLEQAQALLLREAKRAGGNVKTADVAAFKLDQAGASGGSGPDARAQPAPALDQSPSPARDNRQAMAEENSGPSLDPASMPDPTGHLETSVTGTSAVSAASDPTIESAESAEDGDVPPIVVDGETRAGRRNRVRDAINPVNPLVPPLEDEDDTPQRSRLFGTSTWLMIFTLFAGLIVIFEFRTQIMSSIKNIMITLNGA